MTVAIAGLGTGDLACNARPQDIYSFYELDPDVVFIASNSKYFTYINNCKPKGGIILGDARVKIKQEKSNKFDLIVIDVYSAGTIPKHLLTLDAFSIYKDKLKEDGAIAIHVSSAYFNLFPIIKSIADELNFECLYVDEVSSFKDKNIDIMAKLDYPSKWVILSKSKLSKMLKENTPFLPYKDNDCGKKCLWTDSYANIYKALF